MVWIVDNIINSLIAALLGLMDGLMSFVTGMFSSAFGANPETFQKIFPIFENFTVAFQAIGCALVVLLFMLGAFRNIFSGLGFAGERPVNMAIRTVMAFALVFALGPGMNAIYAETAGYKGIFASLYGVIDGVKDGDVDILANFNFGINADNIAGMATGGVYNVAMGIVALVLIVAIGINLVKLLLEMFERYLMVNLLVFFSPLVGAAVTLQSTMKIFSSYLKMFFGQMLMVLMNLISIKLVASGMATARKAFAEGTSFSVVQIDGVNSSFIPYIILMVVLAMLKVMQRMDNYARDIGLTVGITGGSLLEEVVAGSHAVSGMAHGIFGGGKSGGKSGSGGSSGGLLGKLGFSNTAMGGVYGAAGAAFMGLRGAIASRTQPDHPLANMSFGEALSAGTKANLGIVGKDARDYMNNPASISSAAASLAGKSMATKRFFNELGSGQSKASKEFANLGNLRGVKVGNGGMLGIDKKSGNLISVSQQKPAYAGSFTTTVTDKGGQTWYVQNLSKTNEEFASSAQHQGQMYSGYENAMKAYSSDTADFRSVGGHYQAPVDTSTAPSAPKIELAGANDSIDSLRNREL